MKQTEKERYHLDAEYRAKKNARNREYYKNLSTEDKQAYIKNIDELRKSRKLAGDFKVSTKSEHGSITRYTCGCRCDECKNAKNTYLKSTPSYIKRKDPDVMKAHRQHSAIKRDERRLVYAVYKNGPCVDCKLTFPSECMDHDHVRGKKSFNVSLWVGSRRSLNVLKEELAKCDLVCSNCHRIRTKQRNQY